MILPLTIGKDTRGFIRLAPSWYSISGFKPVYILISWYGIIC